MGVAFTLTLNDAEILGGLHSMRALAADLRPTMDRIGVVLESSTVERFDLGQAPDGTPWLQSLRVRLSGGKTLVEHTHLRSSITHNLERDAVEVGSNLTYAAIHQTGFDGPVQVKAHARRFTMVFGQARSGTAQVKAHTRHMKMPARPYLGLSVGDRGDVLAIVQDDFAAAAQAGAH